MKSALIIPLLAALSVPAFAQTAVQTSASPPSATSTGAAMGTAAGGAPMDTARRTAMARVEHHISQLHDKLAITPAQQPQWDAFAAIMRDNAQRMERSYAERATHFDTLSAIDDMKSYAAISREHAANVDRLLPAFETLYTSMTPEQRAAADKTFHNFQRGPEDGKGRRHS